MLAVLNGSSTLELDVGVNLRSPVVDAWNAAFSALMIGGGAVLLSIAIHAGKCQMQIGILT